MLCRLPKRTFIRLVETGKMRSLRKTVFRYQKQMKNFWRTIRLTLKYRFTITTTVVCALILAFFWGANITAVFPLVQISFKGQTVKDYWVEQITEKSTALDNYKTKLAALQEANANRLSSDGKILILREDPAYEETHRVHGEWLDLSKNIQLTEKALDGFRRTTAYVDRYAPKTPYGTVVALMMFVIVGTIVKSVFTFLHAYYSTKIGLLGVFELREVFFAKAVDFEVNYYSQRGVSDTMSRFTNDMGALSGGISIFYGKLLREPLKMIACLIGAALISWRLLLFTFVFIPLVAYVIAWLARKIRKTVRNSMKEMVFMFARIGETFRSIRIIKVFNQERLERSKFRRTNRANFRRAMKITKYGSLVSPMTEVMGMGILIMAILFGAYLVITGETSVWGIPMTAEPLTLGGIMLFFAFLIGASDPARRLSDIFVQLQSSATAADRVYEIIDRQNTLAEPEHPKRLHRFERSIRFHNVAFSYDLERDKIARAMNAVQKENEQTDSRPPRFVLKNIELEIPFGETLAIIGPSGCGKSTLLNLIPRFADPVEGTLSVDDIPLTEIHLYDLRRQIGLITQNPVLFNGTVLQNIQYGTYGKSFDDAVDAARRAYAHDFIVNELKDGYHTQVGPGGGLLSGGQMQRISIARAILKDPKILLLDEATSQIDMQSELLFHNALRDFIGNRTTVIVTHRTGALALADRIVIMNEGKIEQIGTHSELMKKSDYYAGLFVNRVENPSSAG